MSLCVFLCLYVCVCLSGSSFVSVSVFSAFGIDRNAVCRSHWFIDFSFSVNKRKIFNKSPEKKRNFLSVCRAYTTTTMTTIFMQQRWLQQRRLQQRWLNYNDSSVVMSSFSARLRTLDGPKKTENNKDSANIDEKSIKIFTFPTIYFMPKKPRKLRQSPTFSSHLISPKLHFHIEKFGVKKFPNFRNTRLTVCQYIAPRIPTPETCIHRGLFI